MAKPIVHLFTRDDCSGCRCPLARGFLKELEDGKRADTSEFNLSKLPKDHAKAKEARRCGYSHFPTFVVRHPSERIPPVKIWGNDSDKWRDGSIRREVNSAIDAVWKSK